jgi:hypothetical protein
MYFRLDHDLLVTEAPGAPVHHVPWDSRFSFVSAARWCGHRSEMIVTAVEHGRRTPDVMGNQPGDLALYRYSPLDGVWHQVYGGYSHDPVCLPAGGYVVHRGAGLTFIDDDAVVRETKVGRFNWGPPSLSVSPDGATVAWIRWNGHDRKLCLEDVTSGQSRQLTTSVYDYAWLDSATLLYRLGTGPRQLDIATGRTRAFGRPLREHINNRIPGTTPDFAKLAALPADQTWENYGDLAVTANTVWFVASLASRSARERATGLFRTDVTGANVEQVLAVAANELIEHFDALPDRSVVARVAVYEGLTIVDRRITAVGSLAGFLNDGWRHMMMSTAPQMGFHAMP